MSHKRLEGITTAASTSTRSQKTEVIIFIAVVTNFQENNSSTILTEKPVWMT